MGREPYKLVNAMPLPFVGGGMTDVQPHPESAFDVVAPLGSPAMRQHLATTRTGLTIAVSPATGTGPTSLAAFDDALRMAGIANYNLIRLSSVIPPGSTVTARPHVGRGVIDLTDAGRFTEPSPVQGGWGDRLYAVWAYQSAELLGQEAWAGVAWVQDPEDGKGLFVEHEGASESQVREELEASLTSISAARDMRHLEQHSVVVGTRCEGEPVAALVIAPYQTAAWDPQV
jgi:arginine decarboxylase